MTKNIGIPQSQQRRYRSIYLNVATWEQVSAVDIVTDPLHRFVTDAQIAQWNATAGISHARLHNISSPLDHFSGIAATFVLIADANGLPSQGTNTDAQIASAVTLSHTQNTDTGTTSSTFGVDTDSVTGKWSFSVAAGAANKTMTFTNVPLTDDRIVTFKDESGTVAFLSDVAAVKFNGFFPMGW